MARFDDFPAELRNMVYDQLLRDRHTQQPTHNSLALFTVSHQLHLESTSYFYKNNPISTVAPSSPINASATVLPPIADRYLRFLSRLNVSATIGRANPERERKIADTIASLATIGAAFEDLEICIQSSLSRLTNSRVDDSVLHASHPITVSLRRLLDSRVAKVLRLDLHKVWFAPGIAQDLHVRYGTRLQFVGGSNAIRDPLSMERSLTGVSSSSHLTTLGVDDEVMANACSDDAYTPRTPSSLPSSICSPFEDLDMFSVTSFDLNSDTTADDEGSMEYANEGSFFSGADIEEWEASTQAAEQDEPKHPYDIEIDEDDDDDEDEEMEDISQDDMEAIFGNLEETAHHVANDADISYMTNFAPELLLTRHNLGHLE
ncbi:uncharacterized protein J4E78_010874 [Alternaria triticimaculans]|uniref:uncharacterized protein n=1 Tax=Alternaria triticimaculans TaxID=297637 RepID=UPI0020C1FFBF|nr:uncharacterized protein J4E78_010874 [Alternaria triticimaculans]KAI4639547.1 hypothetical protein J4E78_010874 [Alternaria triticimaculans]